MTSNRLFFKLLWEEIKRKAWAAALAGLTLFFAMPVAFAMQISNINDQQPLDKIMEARVKMAETIVGFGTSYPLVMIILAVGAVILGIAEFSYLQSRKQVDFYHSLPVKRQMWFGVNFTSGILIPGLVYLAAVGASLAVAAAGKVLSPNLIILGAKSWLCHMVCYVMIYSFTVLAVMFTGTRIAAVLGTAVFSLFFPAVGALIEALCSQSFHTYYSAPNLFNTLFLKLTPGGCVIRAMSEGMRAGRILGFVLGILGALAVSLFLYQKRPSEAAGKTMAFWLPSQVIKIMLVIPFGLASALFFQAMNDSLGWGVFGAVAGVVISHCIIEVIYHSDFKRLFCHEKAMAACMAVVLAVLLSFHFDVLHYDAYLPGEGDIQQASIDFDMDYWVTYNPKNIYESGRDYLLENGEISDIPALLEIAGEGIRQTELLEKGEWSYDNMDYVTVCYTLKGGRKVYRAYRMDLEPVIEAADRIYTDPAYKAVLYPGIALDEQEAAKNLAYQDNGLAMERVPGTEEQRIAVYRAYQEEAAALSLSQRKEEAPIGSLLLISDEDKHILDPENPDTPVRYYEHYRYSGYKYPVYPSFTKTIEALKACGVETGRILTGENVTEVKVAYSQQIEHEVHVDSAGVTYSQVYTADPVIKIYDDPDQIRSLMEGFVSYETNNSLVLQEPEYDLTVTLKEENGEEMELNGTFLKDRVPDFVIQDFEK